MTKQQQSSNEAVNGLLSSQILLQNQIQAAQLAEQLIDEISGVEVKQSSEVVQLQDSCRSLETHAQTIMTEKNVLSERLRELGKTNDDLKRKFSALLDQFQEYVTQ